MIMLFIASQLTYLAFIANFGTIITVLLCCIAMILFIRQFRLYDFESSLSAVVRVKNTRTEQCLTRISLPFSVKLKSQVVNHGTDQQLHLYSNSFFSCLIVVFRDMPAEKVKSLINLPWPQFKDTIIEEKFSQVSCLLSSEELPHEGKEFTVRVPLNSAPRSSYAVVIFQLRSDDECSEQDPIGLITLVHMPDQFCPSPATIVGQYLKCADNRVLNLKPVYSSERDAMSKDAEEEDETHSETADCVICWSSPASHVLLPCRHACLCSSCFKRVENCPVCRTRILSYFVA